MINSTNADNKKVSTKNGDKNLLIFSKADFNEAVERIYTKINSYKLLYKDNEQLKEDFGACAACVYKNINELKGADDSNSMEILLDDMNL